MLRRDAHQLDVRVQLVADQLGNVAGAEAIFVAAVEGFASGLGAGRGEVDEVSGVVDVGPMEVGEAVVGKEHEQAPVEDAAHHGPLVVDGGAAPEDSGVANDHRLEISPGMLLEELILTHGDPTGVVGGVTLTRSVLGDRERYLAGGVGWPPRRRAGQ